MLHRAHVPVVLQLLELEGQRPRVEAELRDRAGVTITPEGLGGAEPFSIIWRKMIATTPLPVNPRV